MAQNSILGTGMKFPPCVDRATGRFAVSSDQENVRDSIYLLLMTARGERLTAPGFGSNLAAYAFQTVDLTTVSMLERDIRRVLLDNEPRVADVAVEVQRSPNDFACLQVTIRYLLIDSQQPQNLVFPFYIADAGGVGNGK